MIFSRALIGRRIYENVSIEHDEGFIREIKINAGNPDVLGIAIPPFVDTHSHYTSYSLSLTRPRLDGITSVYDALDFIADNVKSGGDRVIIMEGYDDSKWERGLTKEDLDRITDKPIIVRRVCGHKAVLNTAAINLLKSKFKSVPRLNEEDGLAVEDLPLSLSKYFPPTDEDIERAILKAEEIITTMGIVSVGENTSERYVRKLVEMDRKGMLRVRWRVAIYYQHLESLKDLIKYESENFKIVGLKDFLDGSVGAKTAAFSRPYKDGTRAQLLKGDEELAKMMKLAESLGIGVWWHAIGDLAVEQALRVLKTSKNPEIHRIEHFEFPREEHYKIAADMGVKLSLQPNFVKRWGNINGMYHRMLGDMLFWGNRYAFLENLRANYSFGSDTMPPGPLYGLSGAINHPLKEERLDMATAIYRYTTAGANMLGERDYGEIIPGKKFIITVITEECLKEDLP